MLKLLTIKVAVFIITTLFVFEGPYQIQKSEFKVSGTSTLHDWIIASNKISGAANLKINGNVIEEIISLKFSLPAESLKSGKKPMDSNTYKALKSTQHSNIIFELVNIQQLTQQNEKAFIRANGDLTVAGQTRRINLNVTGEVINQEVVFKGSHKLKMTDYKISPPAFLANTIKTGDEVLIDFLINLNNENLIRTNK
jgi:polyisoprenoid-binding protein YceI